jgi:hypothetical protein
MVYAQLDNRFHDHPKVLALLEHDDGLAAIGLWTLAVTWAHSHADLSSPGNAGRIPSSLPRRLGGTEDLAKLLVAVGLWEPTPDGWMIHDFGGRQDLTGWQIRSDKARLAARTRWDARSNATSNANGNAPSNAQYSTEQEHIGGCKPDAPSNAPSNAPSIDGQDTLWAGITADGEEVILRENTEAKRDKSRGTRLSEQWAPSPQLYAWAKSEFPGATEEWLWDQTSRFRDYWLAQAGARARHVSWDLTWRNWIRKARDYAPRNRQGPAERWD